MRSPSELTQLFRERGLKVTPQRQCIFRILHDSDVHPTAEAVYARAVDEMPTISLRTVYQTLHDLADMGELHELELGTGSVRFDPNLEAHHHLVCTSCGKVRDLIAAFPDVRVPRGKAQGFRVATTEIVFRGLCEDCGTRVS
jgi:Fe2+ or Zn2+ uptake regulation protein